MITLTFQQSALSDGSKVYNVLINDVCLPAVSEGDAWALIARFEEAIEMHSTAETQVSVSEPA